MSFSLKFENNKIQSLISQKPFDGISSFSKGLGQRVHILCSLTPVMIGGAPGLLSRFKGFFEKCFNHLPPAY